MIMRTWRGVVRRGDADRYGEYIKETGFTEYGETPGIRAPGCSAATTATRPSS